MGKSEISIVLPCYNEGLNLQIVADRYAKFWPGINFELILVNNGSVDGSAKVLSGLSKQYSFVRIVTVQKNIGYGHGLLMGLKSARADILAYSHADAQTPPEDVMRAYELIKENGYDMDSTLIKGQRVNRREEERFLSKALERVVRCILGYQLTDINGQPKIFSRKFFETFKSPPLDFSFDVYVMCLARSMGINIVAFPVEFGLRVHGESKWARSMVSKYKNIIKQLYNILLIRHKVRLTGHSR